MTFLETDDTHEADEGDGEIIVVREAFRGTVLQYVCISAVYFVSLTCRKCTWTLYGAFHSGDHL